MSKYFPRSWHSQDVEDFEQAISEHVEGMATFQRMTWEPYLPNTMMVATGTRFTDSHTFHSGFCSDHNEKPDHTMACFLKDGFCYVLDPNKCKLFKIS